MGRRLNISQPTVINTTLIPLSDYFDIVASDTLEQWYYVNTGDYSPDRTDTPLILTPTLKAVDEDTGISYSPTLSNVKWYYHDPTNHTDYSAQDPLWPGTGYVFISAVADGQNVKYYCPNTDNPDRHLVVKENVPVPTSSTSGRNICCVATYVDPRDNGVTYMVRQTVLLVTNQDATTDNVTIELSTPPSQKYNVFTSPYKAIANPSGNPRKKLYHELSNGEYVLTDDTSVTSGKTYYSNSIYTISAKVLGANNEDVTNDYYVEWLGTVKGSNVRSLINVLPCYANTVQQTGGGQGKGTIAIDAMYQEQLDIICQVRKSAGSTLMPANAYTSIIWDSPKIDSNTVCKNGNAVDGNERDMTFQTIINVKGRTVSESEKQEHLLINYLRRISTSGSFTDMGWGQDITVKSSTLKQTQTFSTPVHSEVYMIGAYDLVKDDGENVTDNNEVIYDRDGTIPSPSQN